MAESERRKTLAEINESSNFLKKLSEKTGLGQSVRKLLEEAKKE